LKLDSVNVVIFCCLLLQREVLHPSSDTYPPYVGYDVTNDETGVTWCHVYRVSCLYNSNSVLTHNFTGGLLPIKQQKTVIFNFYPTEPIAYRETVTFEINGLTQQSVEIRGKGAELKVAS